MLTCLLVVRKTSKSSHVIAVMAIRAVSPMVSEEVKTLGLPHGAGGNVRCDRRLESSNSTPGNLPLRDKGLNKEGLVCKKMKWICLFIVACHLLNSLSLCWGNPCVGAHLPSLGISNLKLLLGCDPPTGLHQSDAMCELLPFVLAWGQTGSGSAGCSTGAASQGRQGGIPGAEVADGATTQ